MDSCLFVVEPHFVGRDRVGTISLSDSYDIDSSDLFHLRSFCHVPKATKDVPPIGRQRRRMETLSCRRSVIDQTVLIGT